MLRVKKVVICALLGFSLLVGNAMAANELESFTIKQIHFKGLQRVTEATALNYLPVKVGATYTPALGNSLIKALFKTGFFKDVAVFKQGDTLIVKVVERPIIGRIVFNGNKEITDKQLKDILKNLGLVEGRDFNQALLSEVTESLQNEYYNRGRYSAKVNAEITPESRNRVKVAIHIDEGKIAKIKQLKIIGAKAFSQKQLLSNFSLSPSSWLSFLTRNDRYSKPRLNADISALEAFYLNRGYLDYKMDSVQVALSTDKRSLFVTLHITEGPQYRVSQIHFTGESELGKKELRELVAIKPGEIFSRQAVITANQHIVERLGDDGYAFPNVRTEPSVDEHTKKITLTFIVDAGKPAYVRHVTFTGNAKTADEVLRREVRQFEGSLYSLKQIKLSKLHLNQLPYFSSTTYKPSAVPGKDDQLDLNFDVKETPSVVLSAGVGYSGRDGFNVKAGMKQPNFLGTGNVFNFDFDKNRTLQKYSLEYNNPYYTYDGVSRGFKGFFTRYNPGRNNASTFTLDNVGFGVDYGFPSSEFERVRLGLLFKNLNIHVGKSPSDEVRDFIADNGAVFNIAELNAGWHHNTLNASTFPTTGSYMNLNSKFVIPMGSNQLKYYRLSYHQKSYLPLSADERFVLDIGGDIGYGDGYGGTKKLPIFEHFYAGGLDSVAGFEVNSLGRRDSKNRATGGNFLTVGQLGLIFPNFVNPEKLRTEVFANVGNVYDLEESNNQHLRYSVGILAVWSSPVGPLEFSLATPISPSDRDLKQFADFSIYTGF